MGDIVWIENHDPTSPVGRTREDGVTEFIEGVPYKSLPSGIQFEVLEEHYEGGVRYIDEMRLLALSVSGSQSARADQDARGRMKG